MMNQPSLSFWLDEMKIIHERDGLTDADNRRSWFGPTGIFLGRFGVREGWEKVEEIRGQAD